MKTRVLITLAGMIILGFLSISCRHESEVLPGSSNPTVFFDNDVMKIINASCAASGCHNGTGEAPPFLKYEDLVPKYVTAYKPMASKLHKVMVGHPNLPNFMPPSNSIYKITGYSIDLINLWILQGAKDTLYTCDLNPTFTKTIQPIISASCYGCHSGGNPGGGILLIDHKTIKDAVENNFLQDAVNYGANGHIAMPYNSAPLSSCNIDQINTWILNGMPND
jgi:hypothetical protein